MDDPYIAALITLLALLLIAALLKPMADRSHLPLPVLLVLAGMLLGLSTGHWAAPWAGLTEASAFSELIMLILLPTLVFETALGLDARQLLENSRAILFLAVPGLLISAGVITLIIGLLTDLDWGVALLMGIILSATDPAAVITEFRRLGTPKDLSLLVEGESLFNDATTIVLTKITIVALGTGIALQQMLIDGSLLFLLALVGGALHGWLFGRIAYSLLIRLRHDPYVEITLTLLLAYGSYLSAEYLFHTSGIISTAVAALVLARERPLPIPRRVEQHLSVFWSFLSYLATTIIFLMVGLVTRPELLAEGAGLALVVILGMLISRCLVIYGLMPVAGHLRHHPRRVNMAYQHVLNWGGLRGAVTLALAMGLWEATGSKQIMSVALVAVLFTIIIQGLSIGTLTHWLKLDILDVSERIAQAESWLAAKESARQQLGELRRTSFASTGAPAEYEQQLEQEIASLRRRLSRWRMEEEGPVNEWRRLLIRGLSLEIAYTYRLFDQGLLPTWPYIQLRRNLNEQMEALRHDYPRPGLELKDELPRLWRRILGHMHITKPAEMFAGRDYLTAWARRLSSSHAIDSLDELMETDGVDFTIKQDVLKIYYGWSEAAKQQIHTIEKLFPEVAVDQQRLLVKRLALTTQIQNIRQQRHSGLLADGDADRMIEELARLLEQEELLQRGAEIPHAGNRQ